MIKAVWKRRKFETTGNGNDGTVSTVTFERYCVRSPDPDTEKEDDKIKISPSSIRRSFNIKMRNQIRRSFRRTRSCNEEKGEHVEQKFGKTVFRVISTTLVSTFAQSNRQPPAPLVVADPPSSDDGTDLEDVRQFQDPALLTGSSGNFGSAGARSAPTTPAAINIPSVSTCITSPSGVTEPLSQPCSPATLTPSLAIHRSPSHSLFTNRDKSTLKHLSTSTPAMTAQAQLAEPPSPKLTKEAKVPTTSKARQKKFNRHFPAVDDDEKVLNYYSCALIGDILLQGHLYITKNYFAFYSNVFGYVTKLLIPMLSVEKITKEKTARIIPNAVGIATSEDKHVFGSLMSRDNTYRYMTKVWELARDDATQVLEPEPEIVEPVPSDTDSSETREGESGRESPASPRINPRSPSIIAVKLANDKESLSHKDGRSDSTLTLVLKDSITKFATLPRQSLILVASTLLLILLFLSAAILLYRIGKIQNRYTHMFTDSIPPAHLGSEDIYGELLQWQNHLRTKSAGAVHSFLDNNLDQIAKVRQSLEALSALLMANNKPVQEPPSKTSYETKDTS